MLLLSHELKRNRKQLLIWSVCVGFSCFGCILLFESLRESMEAMAGAYAQMGAFSVAFGMDRMDIGTMEGFYAAEVALLFSVGGAMFAAMTGAAMVAKEEEGHTSEFLNTLPLGRTCVIGWKYAAMAALGFSVLLYLMDMMCRIMPDLKGLKYVTPYYFSNATDIFTGGKIDAALFGICLGVTALCVGAAVIAYQRRDLRS